MIKFIRRFWAMTFCDTYTGGLVHPGDWRVVYSDGNKTRWLSHGDAENLRRIYGGRVEWRYD